MDNKLKEAIDKGRSAKKKKEAEEQKALDAKREKHKKYIDSYLPEARKWINDVLFPEIVKIEASKSPYRSIYLGSGLKDGIPAQAIYEAAQKINGLKPTYECGSIYENAEFQGVGDSEYSIKWDSIDPNDNRNDR